MPQQKKKSIWVPLIIYLVIFAFGFLLIFNIVQGFNQKYRTVTTQDGISFVIDKDNKYDLKAFNTVENNGTMIVQIDAKTIDTTTGAEGDFFFQFEMSSKSFYDQKYDYRGEYILFTEIAAIECESGITSNIYQESWLVSWLPTIISVVLIIGIAVFFFKMLQGAAGSNNKAMEFNKSRARKIEDSKTKFKDVAGCDEEKAEMMELVEYLKEPKRFTKNGAKLPKGVLLVGGPGTGKTLLAKAVAGEAGVPFYSISGSDFVEMFVGVGAGRVRDLFKTAKQNAPCIIFIDEIDAVGRQRGAGMGGGNDEREQTLNQLLVELDGFEENSGIIVIAATNRDDVLDPALLRAGRFDRKVTVNLPDKAGREAIFHVHARNKKFADDISFANLARRTVGFSGADIENVLNEAAILAVRGKREVITIADIDEAIDRRIAGPAKSNKGISAHERKLIAYHESGHAIIGLMLPNADKVRKITIIPRGNTGGHVLMGPDNDRFLLTKSELLAEITGLLGGRSSEEVFFQDVTTGASNDIERATQIARAMVVEYGMSSLGPIQYERASGNVFLGRDYNNSQKNFSGQVLDEIDREVRKIVEESHEAALEIIRKHEKDVTLLAETLLEHETISEEQIEYLLKNRKMPDEAVSQRDAGKISSDISAKISNDSDINREHNKTEKVATKAPIKVEEDKNNEEVIKEEVAPEVEKKENDEKEV
ncbi:MAG TPA: ATP-dependent zinc metalloprotease FtsH [Candidatus Onthovivens sp.]|nr:ATP-dependent zinc metalloprotease FtsH [Candidatus Onthovivens sp.]